MWKRGSERRNGAPSAKDRGEKEVSGSCACSERDFRRKLLNCREVMKMAGDSLPLSRDSGSVRHQHRARCPVSEHTRARVYVRARTCVCVEEVAKSIAVVNDSPARKI